MDFRWLDPDFMPPEASQLQWEFGRPEHFQKSSSPEFCWYPTHSAEKAEWMGHRGFRQNQNALDGEAAIFISVWYSPPFGESD